MLNTEQRPCFLVIRPSDRWEGTRTAFAPLDIDLTFTDVLTYTPTGTSLPDLANINGVIVTSLRAMQSLNHIPGVLARLPFYVVGIETARALKVMGLTGPQTVAPTAQALVEVLATQDHKTLLYIRGDEVALDFRNELIGHTVESCITYTSAPKERLDADIMTRMKTGRIQGVMFFSRKSAEAFVAFAQSADLGPMFNELIALCLSEAVLECVHTLSWARTRTALSPDLVGMVGAVRALAQPEIRVDEIVAKVDQTDAVVPLDQGSDDDLDQPPLEEDQVMAHPTTLPPANPSSGTDDQVLNADAIIERFGGIRPMATKIGVPVTTVQGWKKRGVIPANRAHLIEAAANAHGFDIGGLVRIVAGEAVTHISLPKNAPRVRAKPDHLVEVKTSPSPPVPRTSDQKDDYGDSSDFDNMQSISDVLSEIAAIVSAPMDDETTTTSPASRPNEEVKTSTPPSSVAASIPTKPMDVSPAWGTMNRRRSDKVARVTWWSVILLALAVVVGLVVIGPRLDHMRVQDQKLAGLQTDVQRLVDELKNLRSEKILIESAVPADLKDQLNTIQNQARTMENTVASLDIQSKALTAGVMGDGRGTIEQRLSAVEDQVHTPQGSEVTSVPLAVFLSRLQVLYASTDGQKAVDSGLDVLARLAGQAKDPASFQEALNKELTDNASTPVAKVLAGLTGGDTMAGVKVLALTSFRRAVARHYHPFLRELVVLRAADNDQATLIDPLMGVARTGVSTRVELVQSFTKVGDDIIAASLASNHVSLVDRMQARLHTVFKIEHAGRSLTGTTTQRVIDAASRKLAAGDLAGATVILQALDGQAAVKAAIWVDQVESTLTTTKIQDVLTKTIVAEISVHPMLQTLTGLPQGVIDAQTLTRGVVESLSITEPHRAVLSAP